jgi:hypothetical protein
MLKLWPSEWFTGDLEGEGVSLVKGLRAPGGEVARF